MEIDLEGYDDEVGLSSEDKKHARSNNLEWFKGEKGRSYRCALVYFNSVEATLIKAAKKKGMTDKAEITGLIGKALAKRAEEIGKSVDQLTAIDKLDLLNVRFKKIDAHYKEGVGYCLSRLGKDGAEADVVWRTMGDVKTYFTTTLLVYPTDRDGTPIKEALATQWNVIPWRFSSKIFKRLHEVAESLRSNDLNICLQDLSLKCTNTDFQNFDIDGAGKAIWRSNEKLMAKILEKAHPMYDKLVPFRELSTADLKIKLGIGGSAGTDSSLDDSFDGLIDP
jgi:hypothetical protein